MYKIILAAAVVFLTVRGLRSLFVAKLRDPRRMPASAAPRHGRSVKDVPETDYKWRRSGDETDAPD